MWAMLDLCSRYEAHINPAGYENTFNEEEESEKSIKNRDSEDDEF